MCGLIALLILASYANENLAPLGVTWVFVGAAVLYDIILWITNE